MAIPLAYSLRNLWARRLTTVLTAAGIAMVIFVFAAVLMLAYGLEKTLVATGADDNAIVIRRGSQSEMMSLIDRAAANIIRSQPEIATDPRGKPLAASEAVVLIGRPKRGTGQEAHVQTRGIAPESFAMRPQVKLVAGRLFRPGLSEVIVGAAAERRFEGMGLGRTIRFAMRDWTVVGLFEAEGSGFESEIWLDSEQLLQAFRRPVFSSVTVRLSDPSGFDALKQRLEGDPRFNLEVKREKAFYADQSAMMTGFIRVLGLFVTVIFSIGAMIGAMITMYAAVANRTTEIGTLRALGFPRGSILLAFLVESLFLSLIGGGAGLVLASLLQNMTVSTTNFATFSELAFRFALSPAIALESIAFALVVGFLGGFLPAVRAARQNILQSLRAA
ncbi:MAG TPA: ABC transporter permease [Nitrospiria bacterium]|nr:ABC transporter permease [Nitrospiria bacterium]